jgi:hypothetical protein
LRQHLVDGLEHQVARGLDAKFQGKVKMVDDVGAGQGMAGGDGRGQHDAAG